MRAMKKDRSLGRLPGVPGRTSGQYSVAVQVLDALGQVSDLPSVPLPPLTAFEIRMLSSCARNARKVIQRLEDELAAATPEEVEDEGENDA